MRVLKPARLRRALRLAIAGLLLAFLQDGWGQSVAGTATKEPALRTFTSQGIIKAVEEDGRMLVIAHEAIAGYMGAMTMPFKVKNPDELAGLGPGDLVSFRLSVTETKSWIDRIAKVSTASGQSAANQQPETTRPAPPRSRHPLLSYAFTNELGQPVRLGDFHGQALGITFFFTRCPIPDFCPRLSKNFAEACAKLESLPNAPTNWHFLSITFDPEFDTPPVLKAYGQTYHYDPQHWNFLTGPVDKIRELASLSNVTFEKDNGLFNHNFRTLIIDAEGHLQMVFPMGGNLTGDIVSEMLKAAGVTNRPS